MRYHVERGGQHARTARDAARIDSRLLPPGEGVPIAPVFLSHIDRENFYTPKLGVYAKISPCGYQPIIIGRMPDLQRADLTAALRRLQKLVTHAEPCARNNQGRAADPNRGRRSN